MEEYQRNLALVAGQNLTREECQRGYTIRAEKYEKEVIEIARCVGHNRLGMLFSECYLPEERSSVKILDVAAGTGLVGIELKKAGFVHIDALDPNEEMLAKAKARGIYENYLVEFLTRAELDIPKGTYDGLTTCSALLPGEGHLPADCFHEMIRLVKSGGYIAIGARKVFLETPKEEFMKKLEEEGKWRMISRSILPYHNSGHDGIYLIFQVL